MPPAGGTRCGRRSRPCARAASRPCSCGYRGQVMRSCGGWPWRHRPAPASCLRSGRRRQPANPRPPSCGWHWKQPSRKPRDNSQCASSRGAACPWPRRFPSPSKGPSPEDLPMLWVALHFPQFRRQALSRGHVPPEPEQEALAAVAAWACQFTPRVSLEPPEALLMEVEGSLRYYGGRWKFLARLRAELSGLGFEARLGEAPTARAALWLARGEGGSGRIEALPAAVLDL